jgi:rhamnogalacturonyl hydrolase YesR
VLARAEQLFGFVRAAWDRDASHPCPGGVFWTTARTNGDRNAVTTATGALLAMRLYEATRHPGYVDWARRMLGWVDSCLRGPDGLLRDHIDLVGAVDESRWSYNQGSAIGALVLLSRLTGDAGALQRARGLADASLAYFGGPPTGSEPPFFLAIFFRNLLALGNATGDGRYRAAVAAYADAAWSQLRNPSTGLFRFDAPRPEQLLDQAAMVQIYAALAVKAAP